MMHIRRGATLRAVAAAAVLGLAGFGLGAPALAMPGADGSAAGGAQTDDAQADGGTAEASADADSGSGDDAADGSEQPTGPRDVDDALFSWSVNDESTGGSYFGGCNFLVAGAAGDKGSSAIWSAEDAGKVYPVDDNGDFSVGNVNIVKTNGDLSNFETKCLTGKGEKVNGKTNSTVADNFTGDRVEITQGEGEVDPDTDTASIQWKGSWTFAYYGGMTYWTITDPKLEVENGKGRITGIYSGYGADMDDPSKWNKLPAESGTIVELSKGSVDVTEEGFEFTPDYLGVATTTNGRNVQADRTDANESWWGAMPQDWIDYNVLTGQDSYWYTTEGSERTIQPRKKTNALKVTYGVPVEKPGEGGTGAGDDGGSDAGGSSDTGGAGSDGGGDAGGPTAPAGGTATLYWSLNKEANAGAYYGICNFLSAGKAKDMGKAAVWPKEGSPYSATAGNVTIEKPEGSTFKTATAANRCLDAKGNQVSTTAKGSWTQSRVKLSNGAVSESDSGLTVAWKGSFTVAFYGGMSYWSATDPKLEVDANGRARLTATLSGYGADRFDESKWVELKPTTATMANFGKIDVAALKDKGYITATPDYLGASYDSKGKSGSSAAGGGDETASDQAPKDASNAAYWGSFPQDFVDFQHTTGQYSYWFTSGGARDPYKPAEPLTVSLGDYAPGAGDYDAAGGAGQPGQNPGAAGGGQPGAAGGQAAAAKKAAAKKDEPSEIDDETVFAEEAEAQRVASEVPVRAWIAMGTGLAVATVAGFGIRAGIRRSIGLDPRDLV